jgi:hypothetical protein
LDVALLDIIAKNMVHFGDVLLLGQGVKEAIKFTVKQ